MNVDGRILIQRYYVGYLVTDYTSNRKYSKETAEGVIEVLRTIFSAEKLDQNNLFVKKVDPKDESELPSQSQIVTATTPAPKIEEPSPVKSDPLSQVVAAQEPVVIAKHDPEKPTALQKIKELAQIKDPDGLFIPKFECDPAQKKEIEGYSNTSVVELPDGRVMIQYKGAHYYTTKEKVMQQIPYPTPYSHFRKEGIGISSTARTCIRAYRHYLANLLSADKSLTKNDVVCGQVETAEHLGDEQGTCDDITFDSCANNSPENCKFCVNESRFEDKNKLAANKSAPPLMRASVPP